MLTFLQLMWTTILQIVARVFGWWSRVRLGVQLGPGLGLVTQRLSDLDLSRAVPAENPPSELLSEEALRQASDSGPSEELRRANAWAGALERQVRDKPKLRGTVLTTYGFVWLSGRVQLSVIHYLQPMAAFLATPPQPIIIGEWPFPVVIRPWLAIGHSGGQGLDGNCWVTFPDGKGNRHPGVLTARHVVKPRRDEWAIGSEVDLDVDVMRAVRYGRLRHESVVMDAAVIEVDKGAWGQKVPVQHSSVVGFKPVRLVSGHGTKDGDVVEHPGFVAGTIFAEPNREPLLAAKFFMNEWLEPGDSGCLVLDLEPAMHGGQIAPYLIYLGKTNLTRGGDGGVGLFLEQARRVWGLEFFQNGVSVATKDVLTQDQVVGVQADTGIPQKEGELAPILAQSGMRMTVAGWVPQRDETYGWWGVTLAGKPADPPVYLSQVNDPLQFPSGEYDVYWKQDHEHQPMLLAAGVEVKEGELIPILARSGMRITVADWVPKRHETQGWWGAALAGQSPNNPVNWSHANDPLLLPPGQYDVYWKQDNEHQPLLLVSRITVQQNQVVDVQADAGIQIEVADWVPKRHETQGWWGVALADQPPNNPFHWSHTNDPLLLPPGQYDVYWKQDNEHQPMLLASGIKVGDGQVARVNASSGIQ